MGTAIEDKDILNDFSESDDENNFESIFESKKKPPSAKKRKMSQSSQTSEIADPQIPPRPRQLSNARSES